FSYHGVGEKLDLALFHRRVNQTGPRREIRIDLTRPVTLGAEEAGSAFIVDRPGEHRKTPRNHRRAGLVSVFVQEEFVKSRLGRREEKSVRLVVDTFFGTVYSDQFVYFVIIRLDVIVAGTLEVIGSKAQGNSSPLVGPASDHPRAEPVKLGAVLVVVGLPLEIPAADSLVEVAKRADASAGTASWGFPRRTELGSVL